METAFFHGEMILDKGEDAIPLSIIVPEKKLAVLGVFDGLGGSGSAKVTTSEGVTRTSAAWGSFLASIVIGDYYFDADKRNIKKINSYDIQMAVSDAIRKFSYSTKLVDGSKKPKMLFPTTACVSEIYQRNSSCEVSVLWAGDSRAYFLSRKGLQVLSLDDIKGNDADKRQQSIFNQDMPMANVVSNNPEFKINQKEYIISEPGFIFVFTDGIHDIFQSPRYLQNNIINIIKNNDSIDNFSETFKNAVENNKQDDYSASFCIINSSYKEIYDEIDQWENAPVSDMNDEWNSFHLSLLDEDVPVEKKLNLTSHNDTPEQEYNSEGVDYVVPFFVMAAVLIPIVLIISGFDDK